MPYGLERDSVRDMDWTLALAILGVALALASLLWQAWTWMHDGPIVKLETLNHFPAYGDQIGEALVALKVSNRGRSATTIESWGLELPGGSSLFVTDQPAWFTRLPHRLEPHSSIDLRISHEDIRRVAQERNIPFSQFRPWVSIGDGRKVYSKGVPLS